MHVLSLLALLPLLPAIIATPLPTAHHTDHLDLIRRTYAITPSQLTAIDQALSAGHLGMNFADFAKKTGLDLRVVEKIFDVSGLASSSLRSASKSASSALSTSSSTRSTTSGASSTSKVVVASSTSKSSTISPAGTKSSASASSTAIKSSSSIAPSSTVAATSKSSASASPASSAVAAPTSSALSSDAQQFLTLHNNFRKQYGAASFTWNATLASYAAKTASTCNYGHTGGPYGENIAAGVGGGYSISTGFDTWAKNEAVKYNYSNPGYSEATGHFTQIVWKASTQVGCAAQSCADGTIFKGYGQPSTYLVCEFAPPGNWVSSDPSRTAQYFSENVGRPV